MSDPAQWAWDPVDTVTAERFGASLYRCLCEMGSMTAYLRSRSTQLSLSLIHQGIQLAGGDEFAAYMGITPGEKVFVREVVLSCGQQPCILASVMIPIYFYNLQQDWLADLNEQPIGDHLFTLPGLQRCHVSIKQCPVGSQYHHILAQQKIDITKPIWARRSQLRNDTICVGVIEVCLPGLLSLLGCQ